MPRRSNPVLVDTNVILEAHRTSCWRALTSGYRVETVDVCVTETQTGFQRRRPEELIDLAALEHSLAVINPVTDLDHAAAAIKDPQIAVLDAGERALWAHALARTDAWVLCGPDKASMRLGVRLGLRNHLVSLEELMNDIGHRLKLPLRTNYTVRWLADYLSQLVLLEGGKLS